MAARLVKVFHVRLNLGDAPVKEPHPLAALNRDAGASRVSPDRKTGADVRGHLLFPPQTEELLASRPQAAPESGAGASRVSSHRKTGADVRGHVLFPPQTEELLASRPQAPESDAGTTRVPRDHDAHADAHEYAPPPPQAEDSDDGSIRVHRDDRMAVEDELAPLFQTDIGQADSAPDEPSAKPRRRRRESDESLSIRTIALTMAAVIAVGFGFTALLPSMFTRPAVDSTTVITTSPPLPRPAPVQPEQVVTVPPAPAPSPVQPQAAPPAPSPVQPQAAAPPAPALNPVREQAAAPPAPAPSNTKAVARAAPVVTERASGSEEKQVAPRELRDSLIPGTATGRITLTAAEKEAVERGLQALKNSATASAPPRPAAARFALTDAEKEAVERGLRELDKAPGQFVPYGGAR
jgi:hypothetical protein